MIPDKIYVPLRNGDTPSFWSEIPYISGADDNIEYIRKDVRLEWAKEKIRSIANEKDDYFAGKRVAFKQVIEKILSL